MTVLASFVGGWGHVEPLLAVARLAAERRHRVTFAGQAAVVPRLAALGFAAEIVGPDTLSTTRRPLVPVDREMERVVARDHFVGTFGALRADHLGRLILHDRPDLVLCDEMDAGAVIAAELAGIPSVTVGVLAAGRLTSTTIIYPRGIGCAPTSVFRPIPTGRGSMAPSGSHRHRHRSAIRGSMRHSICTTSVRRSSTMWRRRVIATRAGRAATRGAPLAERQRRAPVDE